MTISDAARATRKWHAAFVYGCGKERSRWVVSNGVEDIDIAVGQHDAQAACDRLNLLAVLEAIREPIGVMVDAGYGYTDPADIWRAMIDAAIKKVRKAGNDRAVEEAVRKALGWAE